MQARTDTDKVADKFWEELPYEDKLKAFYSVVKRIYQGEVEDKGSYRYILYDVFGFGPEAYAIGMDCGYMYLHNSIMDGEQKLHNKDGSIHY
jgi:hypothetical protein